MYHCLLTGNEEKNRDFFIIRRCFLFVKGEAGVFFPESRCFSRREAGETDVRGKGIFSQPESGGSSHMTNRRAKDIKVKDHFGRRRTFRPGEEREHVSVSPAGTADRHTSDR